MQHVLLIGATDGIGLALARHYLAQGWRVGLVGRSRRKLSAVAVQLRSDFPKSSLSTVQCDVTDRERVSPAFAEALRALGQVDLFIYCAGVMFSEAETGERARSAADVFEVNVVGAVRWLERAGDYLAEVGRGHIAALGSVAGDRGRKGTPIYNASKAALHAYLEGLRHRLYGSGVTVSTVKPGWVQTRLLPEGQPLALEPEEAARRIAKGLGREREVFYVPFWWRGVSLALRLMPLFLFKRFGPA